MRALAAICLCAAWPLWAQETPPAPDTNSIIEAAYFDRTDVYGHGAVEGGEYAGLRVTFSDGSQREIFWDNGVFEDTSPRLFDLDGDGDNEVITVASTYKGGAQVQLFASKDSKLIPAGHSAPIGTRNRWLAIIGIADFNGDGIPEVAYIDRPHLAKELVLLSVDMQGERTVFKQTRMKRRDLTNHKYGAPFIEGGLRVCADQPPVIVTADGDWQNIMETRFLNKRFKIETVAPYAGPESFAPFLSCE